MQSPLATISQEVGVTALEIKDSENINRINVNTNFPITTFLILILVKYLL